MNSDEIKKQKERVEAYAPGAMVDKDRDLFELNREHTMALLEIAYQLALVNERGVLDKAVLTK